MSRRHSSPNLGFCIWFTFWAIVALIATAHGKPLTYYKAFVEPDAKLCNYLEIATCNIHLIQCGSHLPGFTPYHWPGWNAHMKMVKEKCSR